MTRVDLVVWVSAQTFPRPVTPSESGHVIVGIQRGWPFRANILDYSGHISLSNGSFVHGMRQQSTRIAGVLRRTTIRVCYALEDLVKRDWCDAKTKRDF